MFQKSDIQVLISTMNRSNFDFLEDIFLFSDYKQFNILIVNQTSQNNLLVSDNDNIKVYNVFENGLSKSRNLAIQNATKKLLIFADDDIVFKQNFESKILKAFNEHPNSDGFRFQFLNRSGNYAKKYPKKFRAKLSKLELLNTSSVELVVKNESIKHVNVKFDEHFGLGTIFFMGEEAIFVSDLIKKGLKIGFIPEQILLHNNVSTGNKTESSSLYFVQSAVFYRIFGMRYLFWIGLKLFFDLNRSKIKLTSINSLFQQAQKGKLAYVNATKM